MQVFVISDTHWGHSALSDKFKERPTDFEVRISQNWQRMIKTDDLVIHLGDVLFGNRSDWSSILTSLPGRKILVMGNHDKRTISWYMANGFEFCCESFHWQMYGLNILFSHKPALHEVFVSSSSTNPQVVSN